MFASGSPTRPFISPDLLCDLTARWLGDHGWKFAVNAAGRPIVLTAELERLPQPMRDRAVVRRHDEQTPGHDDAADLVEQFLSRRIAQDVMTL